MAYTITLGDVAENHVGMERIGTPAEVGLTTADLQAAMMRFVDAGAECSLIDLVETAHIPTEYASPASLLVIKNGLSYIVPNENLKEELDSLVWDTKAKMYGRVVDKKARHNLCFADVNSEPDYAAGRGRVVSFNQVPTLYSVREKLPQWFGSKTTALVAEGNYYYDVSKCGIGFHGDTERRIVIAIRCGASMPLDYQWYSDGTRIGNRISIVLEDGDMYAMSDKAVGHDWKRRNIFTLRHAAGAASFRV